MSKVYVLSKVFIWHGDTEVIYGIYTSEKNAKAAAANKFKVIMGDRVSVELDDRTKIEINEYEVDE